MNRPPSIIWPSDKESLRRRFQDADFCAEEWPSGDQAALLLGLLKAYADAGLAPATQPLCECCQHAASCWSSASGSRRAPSSGTPEDGGVILPWVGSHYRPGGLLVLAVNPNIAAEDRTYLLSEHEISWDIYDPALRGLGKTAGRSVFAPRMARSAALLIAYANRAPLPERDSPDDLAQALHRTARLQTVKCVPRRQRSRPTPAMIRRCPEFLLQGELAVLQPRFILSLGTVPDAALERLAGYEYVDSLSSEHLWRHRLNAAWGPTEVFALPHPADPRGGWLRGHEALREALTNS